MQKWILVATELIFQRVAIATGRRCITEVMSVCYEWLAVALPWYQQKLPPSCSMLVIWKLTRDWGSLLFSCHCWERSTHFYCTSPKTGVYRTIKIRLTSKGIFLLGHLLTLLLVLLPSTAFLFAVTTMQSLSWVQLCRLYIGIWY